MKIKYDIPRRINGTEYAAGIPVDVPDEVGQAHIDEGIAKLAETPTKEVNRKRKGGDNE